MDVVLQEFLDDVIDTHFPNLPAFIDKEKFYNYQRNVLISIVENTDPNDFYPPLDSFLFPSLSRRVNYSNNFQSLLDREDFDDTHFFVSKEIREQIMKLNEVDNFNFDFKNN